jgi:hypothetical protein
MASQKAENPATDFSVNGAPEFVQLPGQNKRENKPLPLTLQVAHLARRFNFSAARATLTANLAFGSAVRQ